MVMGKNEVKYLLQRKGTLISLLSVAQVPFQHGGTLSLDLNTALSKTVGGADNSPRFHTNSNCIQDPIATLWLMKKGHTNTSEGVC